MNTHVVKQTPGRVEMYDESKLYASLYASCLGVRTPAGEAEVTAQRICQAVQPWLAGKPEVTSADIRRKAAEQFVIYNPDAAYLYQQQRLIA